MRIRSTLKRDKSCKKLKLYNDNDWNNYSERTKNNQKSSKRKGSMQEKNWGNGTIQDLRICNLKNSKIIKRKRPSMSMRDLKIM